VSGIIHSNVEVGRILRSAAAEARSSCEEEWGVAPRVDVIGDGAEEPFAQAGMSFGSSLSSPNLLYDRQFTYVPIHLHFVCYQLLLNSCRAVAIRWRQRQQEEQNKLLMSVAAASKAAVSSGKAVPLGRASVGTFPIAGAAGAAGHAGSTTSEVGHGGARWQPEGLPAVRAIFAYGEEEVSLKVSDEGGGIPRSELGQAWSYFGNLRNSEEEPKGVGLPLSRLHARYYGGDVVLKSLEGFGTDAYVFLNRLGQNCENLPPGVRVSPAERDSSVGPAASIRLLESLENLGDISEAEVAFLTRRLRSHRQDKESSFNTTFDDSVTGI